jgi:hypothetical protein
MKRESGIEKERRMPKNSLTRRDFLKTAGTFAAAAALGAGPPMAWAEKKDEGWRTTFRENLKKDFPSPPPARPLLEFFSMDVTTDSANNRSLLNIHIRNRGSWPSYSAYVAVYEAKTLILCPYTDRECDIHYRFSDLLKVSTKVVTVPPGVSTPLKISIDHWSPQVFGGFTLGTCFDPLFDPPTFNRIETSVSQVRNNRQLNGLLRSLFPSTQPYRLIRSPQPS